MGVHINGRKMQHKLQSCKPRLQFPDLLVCIEQNGGAAGLNLGGMDLSEINLHYEVVRQAAQDRPGPQLWISPVTQGINLRGVNLGGANLTRAVLRQADLTEAALYETTLHDAKLHDAMLRDSYLVKLKANRADFSFCNLSGCYLLGANLEQADFSNARLQGADMRGAVLSGADFSYAKLQDADFTDASLNGVNFYGTSMAGTHLTRQQIGERIIQEDDASSAATIDGNRPGRYAQASAIYRVFKNNFLSLGNYEDASWAYIKERQMRRKTHWPPNRIRENHLQEWTMLPNHGLFAKLSRLRFVFGHLGRYFLDSVFELSSQYGESPLRTLAWSLILIAGFVPLYYLMQALGETAAWVDYLNYSLGAFVTITDSSVAGAGAKALTSIEGLLGVVMLGLLIFAVGNRIRRS